MKILHDYFDIECHTVGYNKEGVPVLKLKKVNRSQSQNKLDNSMNGWTKGTTPPKKADNGYRTTSYGKFKNQQKRI